MLEKIFFHLLIFGGIVSQGIIGTLSDEEIGKSSEFIVRNKRVINHEPGGNFPTLIENAPYIVRFRRNGRLTCVGSILSHYSVITAATCVSSNLDAYQILAGSGYVHRSLVYNLTSKETFYGHRPYYTHDGIALVTVDPPFDFFLKMGPIVLYEGPVHTGIMSTVSGWGYCHPHLRSMEVNRRLRTITIPIMDHAVCTNTYRHEFRITDRNICTYHPDKACAESDIGTPLVINHMLAGVHVWKGESGYHINPDVFINTQQPEYLAWIKHNTILM